MHCNDLSAIEDVCSREVSLYISNNTLKVHQQALRECFSVKLHLMEESTNRNFASPTSCTYLLVFIYLLKFDCVDLFFLCVCNNRKCVLYSYWAVTITCKSKIRHLLLIEWNDRVNFQGHLKRFYEQKIVSLLLLEDYFENFFYNQM